MSSTNLRTSPWKYPILAPTDRNISSDDLARHGVGKPLLLFHAQVIPASDSHCSSLHWHSNL